MLAKIVSNYIVYGSDQMKLTPNFVHFERIESSRLKNRGEVASHIHSNIFQFIYISEGSILFKSEKNFEEVKAGHCVTIPENSMHALRFNQHTKGAVVTISQMLFLNLFSYNYEVPNSFQEISVLNVEAEADYLNLLMLKLEKQQIEMLEPHEVTVRSLLSLIINVLFRITKKDSLVRNQKVKLNDYHFTKFIKLIRKKSGTEKELLVYARELGMTTTHLNRICKQTVGKTASTILQEYIVLEAKRFLLFTSHSVAEIAYMLEFSTPSYFNRFFKKCEGITPREFRLNHVVA